MPRHLTRAFAEALRPQDGDDTRPALVLGGQQFSYAQLWQRVATFLPAVEAGEAAGQRRILIDAEKCLDAYAVELACVIGGATFCPLNLAAPPARNAMIAHDFAPDVVFAGPGALELAALGLPHETPRLAPRMDGGAHAWFSEHIAAEAIAYVIFTSGTTGRPKGVQISYANLAHGIAGILERLTIPAGARWSNQPNLAFDLSILDLFGALLTRSTLYPLVAELDRAFPGRFIAEHALTVWHSVPSLVPMLARLHAGERGRLRSLERVILCGEPLQRASVEYLLAFAHPEVQVFNAYGPTETTVFCTLETIDRAYCFDPAEQFLALGAPIRGTTLTLRDHGDGRHEARIAGPGVSPGYLQTTVGETNGYGHDERLGRCYDTGDAVQRRGGRLYFRGRFDTQVKLRGNRFELGEIDAALSAAGFPESCAVLCGDQVALFVASATAIDEEQIRAALTALPAYAQPRTITRVDALPRTPNDKLDRRALALLAGGGK